MNRTLPVGVVVRLVTATILAIWTMLVSTGARADALGPMPPLDGVRSPLSIRVVGYSGGTNGEMLVEVHNPTKKSATFVARGLYFVPGGDPEQAPQRLGATGPLRAPGEVAGALVERLDVAPGATLEVGLEVFCIDSHRASPTADDRFSLAKRRLPKTLRAEIEAKTAAIVRQHKGKLPAPAKMAVQSDVWSARDRKWVALDGERKVEKVAPRAAAPAHPTRHPAPKRPIPIEGITY